MGTYKSDIRAIHQPNGLICKCKAPPHMSQGCRNACGSSQNFRTVVPSRGREGLMLKLKLQYLDHLMQKIDSFKKILMLGKIECGRRRG